MNENILKKEFQSKDVQRVRNIVNKDYTAKTRNSAGYSKAEEHHEEGDVWDEAGQTWTVKNGIKQNITKLDSAKKAHQVPLCCPKCDKRMKHRNDTKMYGIHKMCFDCVIDMESALRKAGLYKQYEKSMMQGSMKFFVKEIEQWVQEAVMSDLSFVTEDGTLEDWDSNSEVQNNKMLKNVADFVKHIKEHIEED